MIRISRDLILAILYKLRMFGVPLDGPYNVICNNQGLVNSTSLPQSSLGNKQNSVNYHVVNEAVTAGILWEGRKIHILIWIIY